MAEGFEELGVQPELVAGAEDLGWVAPSPLQRDATPVLRRGNNIVLHASTGAGVVGAYGLGLLDRLLEESNTEADGAETATARPRALILVQDAAEASRTGRTLAALAGPAGLTVRALATGWAARAADLLVATPAAAVAAVRDSSLKLEPLTALVVDGADRLRATGQWDSVETLIEYAPAGAQKVVVTGAFDSKLDSFLERHVRRALNVPSRPVEEPEREARGTVPFAVASGPDKVAAAIQLLSGLEAAEVAVVCRTPDRAEEVESALLARGVQLDDPERRVLVLPRLEADQRSVKAEVLCLDVPFDDEELAALYSPAGTVVVTPGEIAHLRRIAKRAGFKLRPVPLGADAPLTAAEAVRDRLRQTMEEDLSADLALIEPLLQEFTAPEIAAAALRLARGEVTAVASGATTGGSAVSAQSTVTTAAPPSGTAPPPSTNWVRLFITGGSRDEIGPGDLVGAITGEAGVEGDRVGKIDVRESHSTVEVPAEVADQVIKALNGRSMRGRSLRVDYDRKGRSGSGSGGGAGSRGGRGPAPGGDRGGRRPGPGGGRGGRGPGGGGRAPGSGARGGGSQGGRRPGGRGGSSER